MTGKGELTYATEALESYTGQLVYPSESGSMIVNLAGKVVGTCDKPMSR
jgi:hypothetical protein